MINDAFKKAKLEIVQAVSDEVYEFKKGRLTDLGPTGPRWGSGLSWVKNTADTLESQWYAANLAGG